MINETLAIYGIIVGAVVSISYAAIRTWYETHRNNKLESEIHTCRIEIGKLKSKMREKPRKTQSNAEERDLSNADVPSLLDEFGIDSSILENPIVQKMIEKYAGNLFKDKDKDNKNTYLGQ